MYSLAVAVSFLATLGLSATAASAPPQTTLTPQRHMTYETVTGYFLQDDPTTNATAFNYTTSNFGLKARTYDTDASCDPRGKKTQWQRFACKVASLNEKARPNVSYRVLFMGRHGEGYHNAAEAYYGTPAWNCYWSIRNGNRTVTWADAHLTPTGIQQALIAHNFWATEMTTQKITTPQSFYTSPLYRCLATANLTFSGLALPKRKPFAPTVKELFRESISGHTCDRRSNATFIQESFPGYTLEPGFSEDDELWERLHGETATDQDIRSRTVLDEVFASDDSTWISITSHSGEIGSILRVIGHQPFSLNTGAVIPVLLKVKDVRGEEPPSTTQPYTTISTCSTRPPLPTSS